MYVRVEKMVPCLGCHCVIWIRVGGTNVEVIIIVRLIFWGQVVRREIVARCGFSMGFSDGKVKSASLLLVDFTMEFVISKVAYC